jgi:tol-pal system protein YbgF
MRARVPVLLGTSLLLSGCLATKTDILAMQTDMKAMRAEYAFRDSTRRAQFDSVVRVMVSVNDTVRTLKTELAAFQGNVLGDLFKVRDGLIEIRSLTGQSQSRITELRAELEQRNAILQQSPAAQPPAVMPQTPTASPSVAAPSASQATSAPPTGGPPIIRSPDSAAASSGAAPMAPGPNQLYTMALDQLRRGSNSAARAGFTDFLAQYPTHERAGDSQYYIAETLEREGKTVDAEAAFLSVYTRFPRSEKAPTSMFKRAALLRTQNKADRAKEVLELLVRTYPRSDEADLARERLRTGTP